MYALTKNSTEIWENIRKMFGVGKIGFDFFVRKRKLKLKSIYLKWLGW